MIFKYRGIDKEGKKRSGRVEANSLEEAKSRLKMKGIYYDKISESGQSLLTKLSKLRARPLPTKRLSALSRNLSIYLKSSIPILQAIKLAKSQSDEGKILDFLTAVETMLDEGQSFYTALESQDAVILPDFYKQSIKIAEENGVLSDVLAELSEFLLEQDRVTKQISQAMVYPMFIIAISVMMVSVMLTLVVPKITSMFTQMKQEIPQLTQFVISAGDFLQAHWLLLSVTLLIVASIFSLLMRYSYKFKYRVHLYLLKTPFLGRVIQTSELTRFSYISSLLIKSGVNFVHTIKLAGNTLNNAVLKEKMLDASKVVVEGSKFSQALVKDKRFKVDKAFIQSIALGEETSQVANILDNLANLYQQENKDSITLFLSLLEPLLILFVGATIGVIVTAMLLPIFSLNLGAM